MHDLLSGGVRKWKAAVVPARDVPWHQIVHRDDDFPCRAAPTEAPSMTVSPPSLVKSLLSFQASRINVNGRHHLLDDDTRRATCATSHCVVHERKAIPERVIAMIICIYQQVAILIRSARQMIRKTAWLMSLLTGAEVIPSRP